MTRTNLLNKWCLKYKELPKELYLLYDLECMWSSIKNTSSESKNTLNIKNELWDNYFEPKFIDLYSKLPKLIQRDIKLMENRLFHLEINISDGVSSTIQYYIKYIDNDSKIETITENTYLELKKHTWGFHTEEGYFTNGITKEYFLYNTLDRSKKLFL